MDMNVLMNNIANDSYFKEFQLRCVGGGMIEVKPKGYLTEISKNVSRVDTNILPFGFNVYPSLQVEMFSMRSDGIIKGHEFYKMEPYMTRILNIIESSK